jgi:hypothetical protein
MQNNECAEAHKHLVERRGGLIRFLALSPHHERTQAHIDPVIRQTVADVIDRIGRGNLLRHE